MKLASLVLWLLFWCAGASYAQTVPIPPVQSVNGRIGSVTISSSDISDFSPAVSAIINAQGFETTTHAAATYTTAVQAAAAAPVQSVAGRTGTVVLGASDIANFISVAAGAVTGLVTTVNGISPVAGHCRRCGGLC